ncbi:MAG: HAMP domain-containing protein [Planctomycetota bacterium]|nr:HAMP domain-containing protein [Planctomycetota bacterium]
MPKRLFLRTTLERRGRLVFGLFILLTVAACLWWPWWMMEQLVQSGDSDRAQTLARAYLQSTHALGFVANVPADKPPAGKAPPPDALADKRVELLTRFGRAEGEGKLRRISLAPATPGQPQAVPAGLGEFEHEAVKSFLKHPKENTRWEKSGDSFLYVQAFRAEGECLDCHRLKGFQPKDLIGAVAIELNVKERQATILANRLVLVAASLLVVVFSVAMFYAVFRYMVVKPIQHLKDVADRVSEGDLQVRSEIDTGNELEVLSDALNHMLDETAKAQAELRAATQARDARLDELTKANVALFESNQVKNKFLATMSHELRTPLNSILGFAQILSDSPAVADDPKLGRYARNILSSGRMLLDMINDLLDLAKIEAGRLQVRCEKVSPQDIAEVTWNMVRPLLAEAPLKFSYEVDPATPIMVTDATKVQQILYNLLSNAIKFTEEGEVRLVVRPAEGDGVAFAVADTSIESEVGRGSTFTVVLPADSSAAQARMPEAPAGAAPTPEGAAARPSEA